MLDVAAKAIESGDDARALSLLVAAWRETRSPEIAALVDLVDQRQLCKRIPTLAWDAREIAFEDLGGLLRALELRRAPSATACLERVRDRDDPRLATFVLGVLVDPPFPAKQSTQPFWRLVFSIAMRLCDPRVLVAADIIGATFAAKFAVGTDMAKRLRKTLGVIAAEYPGGPPPLSIGDAAIVERARERIAPRGSADARIGEQLLAQIRATPDDDAPRLVYADWLAERGDPRGELVALQIAATTRELSRHERGRVQALLNDHVMAWLGPIAAIVDRGSVRFARGFLDEVEVSFARSRVAAIAPDPGWSTVTRVIANEPTVIRALVQFGALHNLRRLDALLSIGDLAHLARRSAIFSRLETIRIRTWQVGDATIEALLSLRALPSLRCIELGGIERATLRYALQGKFAPADCIDLGNGECLVRTARGTLA